MVFSSGMLFFCAQRALSRVSVGCFREDVFGGRQPRLVRADSTVNWGFSGGLGEGKLRRLRKRMRGLVLLGGEV